MANALTGLGIPDWQLDPPGGATSDGVTLTGEVTIPTASPVQWVGDAVSLADSSSTPLTSPRPAASWMAARVGGSIKQLFSDAGEVGGNVAVAFMGYVWITATQWVLLSIYRSGDEDPERIYPIVSHSSLGLIFNGRETHFIATGEEDSPHVEVYVAVFDGQLIFGWNGVDVGQFAAPVTRAGPRAFFVSGETEIGNPESPWTPARADEYEIWYGNEGDGRPPWAPQLGVPSLRQEQTLAGNRGGPPLRQLHNGNATGSYPLRQAQRGD